MSVSQLGDKLAWHDGTVLKVYDVASNKLIHSIECPAIAFLEFSPKSTILATWRNYTGQSFITIQLVAVVQMV